MTVPALPLLRLRNPLPSGVVSVGLSDALLGDVRAALEGHTTVTSATTVRECTSILERHVGVCVICRVPSVTEDVEGHRLLELRAQFPKSAWVALHVEQESDSRWALRLGRAGVTELLPCARHVPAQALVAVLARVETETVAMRVWKQADMRVGEQLVAVLKPALRLAHAPITLVRYASAAGWHERTLRKYCDGAGLPSPQWIAGWARLLIAAYYLDEPGRTIQSVAELLAFPGPASLANHVRRYAAMTPRQLRTAGAVHTIARLIETRLGAHCRPNVSPAGGQPRLIMHRIGRS